MRVAETAPVACSCCLQPASVRDPRPRYVDFEVAWDGPVFTREGERPEEFTPIPIDDMILCEDCVKAAAEKLGFGSIEALTEKGEDKDNQIRELKNEVAEKNRAISDLSYSVGVVIDHPVKRGKGAPQVRGPETHTEEVKTIRSRRKMAAKVSKTQKEKAKA